jgi:Carboxypeptidase regulatory-like domain
MRKFDRVLLLIASLLVLMPAATYAQASIAGIVKDSSGAVLPGVTVEAASPALIEKARSVVTDATGQYRIVDLRPGTYSVTFTLAGFSTVKREGVELTGSFTATVSPELKVGGCRRAECDGAARDTERCRRRDSGRA